MNTYRDVVFCNRDLSNAKAIRNTYALHALNHVTKLVFSTGFVLAKLINSPFRTRDRVLKNNAKLSKAQKEGTDAG